MQLPIDQILCGRNEEVLATFPTESIDLTVTSPPYDNLRKYNGYAWDFNATARQLYRVTKPGGVVVWVVADATIDGSETGTSFRHALGFMEIGFKLHDTMIYQKPHIAFPDSNRYYQAFEYMFVLSKGAPKTFNPLKDKLNVGAGRKVTGLDRNADGSFKERSGHGRDYPTMSTRYNVWLIANANRDVTNEHVAIFPERLAEDHILSWSNPGDVVLDSFVGSGTTAKMAIKHHRRFIGIDISPEYCELARRRISAVQPTMFDMALV